MYGARLLVIAFCVGAVAQTSFAADSHLQRFRFTPKLWQPFKVLFPFQVSPKADPINLGLMQKNANFAKANGELVARSAQYIAGAKLSGSWVQTIYAPSGQIVYSSGSVVETIPAALEAKINLMRASISLARASLERQSYEFTHASLVQDPAVEVADLAGVLTPLWVFDYVTRNEEHAYRARLKPDGELLDINPIEVSFSNGKAVVFPQGPKIGGLGEVSLTHLDGAGSLSGEKIAVTSALNVNVYAPNLFFNFQTDDRRFDEVQVYYYVEKAMEWFQDKLQASVPGQVQTRVHIGEAGVSNAAFYHAKTIYLGTGDGKTYKDMLKDPSIVIHETSHAIIDVYAGLPPDGEGGSFNEGFADFFAASILDNPNMGEVAYLLGPYKRTLKNNLKAFIDFDAGVYKNGTIIGGTLWDIRERVGADRMPSLAFRTLVRLGSGAKFVDFVPAILHACVGYCTDAETHMVEEALAARGWKIMQNELF